MMKSIIKACEWLEDEGFIHTIPGKETLIYFLDKASFIIDKSFRERKMTSKRRVEGSLKLLQIESEQKFGRKSISYHHI